MTTDPRRTGSTYRAAIACHALAAVRTWANSADMDGAPLDPDTTGDLVSCAGWLLEALAEEPPMMKAVSTGQANAAVSGLTGRECRDVLYALAASHPAVLAAAVAEASGAGDPDRHA